MENVYWFVMPFWINIDLGLFLNSVEIVSLFVCLMTYKDTETEAHVIAETRQ
jgi:hypothetical protein